LTDEGNSTYFFVRDNKDVYKGGSNFIIQVIGVIFIIKIVVSLIFFHILFWGWRYEIRR